MPESNKPVAEVFTLEALAKMFGQVQPPAPHGDKYKSDHACAAALHGWNKQEYHYGSLSMSVEDYTKALMAARSGTVHAAVNMRKPRKA